MADHAVTVASLNDPPGPRAKDICYQTWGQFNSGIGIDYLKKKWIGIGIETFLIGIEKYLIWSFLQKIKSKN